MRSANTRVPLFLIFIDLIGGSSNLKNSDFLGGPHILRIFWFIITRWHNQISSSERQTEQQFRA